MSGVPGSRAGILCAGTILVDVAKVIDAYPALDHLATIEQVSLSTGGPGLNMAVDLRMLGAAFPIGVLGAVGDDEHAAFILAECARLGINSAGVRKLQGAVTSFTDAMIERDGGRRTFFHHSGANALFDSSTAELETPGARILHAGAPGIHPVMDSPLPGGGNGWSALLQRAQAAGLHTNMELVSIEPGRIAEVAAPCLPYADSIVINELEAGALTGIDASVPTADGPTDWPALEAMALGMIERGVSTLAVVHFPAAPQPPGSRGRHHHGDVGSGQFGVRVAALFGDHRAVAFQGPAVGQRRRGSASIPASRSISRASASVTSTRSAGPSPRRTATDSSTSSALPTARPGGASIRVSSALVRTPCSSPSVTMVRASSHHGGAAGQGVRHPDPVDLGAGRNAVRRQPAEGHSRPRGGPRRPAAAGQPADPRPGCRVDRVRAPAHHRGTAFRAGLFNIGAQSQLIGGAILAIWLGFGVSLPPVIHVIVCVLGAFAGGAALGWIVGFLKARTGAHEVIVTIMLNYVMAYFLSYLLSKPSLLEKPGANGNLISPNIASDAHLSLLAGTHLRVNAGFLLALACAAGVWWLMSRSTLGFEFRTVGANPNAARSAGMSVPRTWLIVMLIAGGLAGLSASTVIQGTDFSLNFQSYGTYGIDAITVALLGRARPGGVVLAALLFGALHAGAPLMQTSTGTPVDIVQVIQALIVMFVAAPPLIRALYRLRAARAEGTGQVMSKGWNARRRSPPRDGSRSASAAGSSRRPPSWCWGWLTSWCSASMRTRATRRSPSPSRSPR